MTFKRITIIIVSLLILAGLLFGVSWYIARKNAEKSGTDPLSFREFLGIGTPNAPGQSGTGELSGEFTGQPQRTIKYDENNNGINDWLEDTNNNGIIDGDEDFNNNGIPDGQEDFDNNGVPNSQDMYREEDIAPIDPGTSSPGGGFTEEPYTPEGTNPGDTDGGPGGGNPGDTDTPGNTGNPGGGTGNVGGDFGDENDVPPDPTNPIIDPEVFANLSCKAEDINIVFTEAELARLKTLQARFETIKATLYDDAASNQQLSLYSSFKVKADQTNELLNFCENNVSKIGDAKMNRRVPTPFYHDSGKDSNTFTNNRVSTSDSNSSSLGYRPLINNPITITTLLERLLRINIW